MSVDGYEQWVENKAEDYVGELTKKNPQASKEKIWELALEQASYEYQNTDCDYDYEEEEEEVSEQADNLNALNSENFVNYKKKV